MSHTHGDTLILFGRLEFRILDFVPQTANFDNFYKKLENLRELHVFSGSNDFAGLKAHVNVGFMDFI